MLLPIRVPLCDLSGARLAVVEITPRRDLVGRDSDPVIIVDPHVASEYGETEVQLREAEVYEYLLQPEVAGDLRLRSSLSSRRKGLKQGERDSGQIETRSYCGTLLLELVEDGATDGSPPLASARIDVRSLKVNYRTEYRGMVVDLSERLEALVVEADSSAQVPFRSNFADRSDVGWLQIQLELLRSTLDAPEFGAAMDQILSFPHEGLVLFEEPVPSNHSVHATGTTVRRLLHGAPRRPVPVGHALHASYGIASVAAHVNTQVRCRHLDTPENQFVKHALGDLRSFLEHAHVVLYRSFPTGPSTCLAERLCAKLNDFLGRSMFAEIGAVRLLPLGSPVLQRKAGYREILRLWLRFRTAAELSWDGGADVFGVGQRDVATLYEYWLFFALRDWFLSRCDPPPHPPRLDDLVTGLNDGTPNLRLKRGVTLGPFSGCLTQTGRRLMAQFTYNRRFDVARGAAAEGSWTRRLQPDYTLTFWPEEMTPEDAATQELLVHIHFDAKYRVSSLEALFGGEEDQADATEAGTMSQNYKRQDLLKMHAYRDAIRRSQGAYVLYPGERQSVFQGYHEILPGLGAFGIRPDECGRPQGMDALAAFLDEVIDHLADRGTAQERVSYHVWDSYRSSGALVPQWARSYGVSIDEADHLYADERALPLAEQMVLVAWYENTAQLDLARRSDGVVYVRLGSRRGALRVHPNFARTRHVVLRSHGGVVAPGLFALREDGYDVFTRLGLREHLRRMAARPGVSSWEATEATEDPDTIYAVFKIRPDPAFDGLRWDGQRLMELVEQFESRRRNQLATNIGRLSPYPRLVPMQQFLTCGHGGG